jgi:hypothetical protein
MHLAGQIIQCLLSHRALVPAWFVCVGVVALWLLPPTVAIGALLLALTVVVIPGLMVAVDVCTGTCVVSAR